MCPIVSARSPLIEGVSTHSVLFLTFAMVSADQETTSPEKKYQPMPKKTFLSFFSKNNDELNIRCNQEVNLQQNLSFTSILKVVEHN